MEHRKELLEPELDREGWWLGKVREGPALEEKHNEVVGNWEDGE